MPAQEHNNDLEESEGDEEGETSEDDTSDADLRRNSSTMQAEKIRGSFKSPATWMLVAGMLLASCAGIVNVTALLKFGTVVTHVTGHATAIGMRVEGLHVSGMVLSEGLFLNNTLTKNEFGTHLGKLQEAMAIIFSFVFGAVLCGLVIPKNSVHFGGKAFYGVALLLNSALLILCAVISHNHKLIVTPACIAACASGLQNAMCTMHLGAVVRTTHVTGTSTDIGSTSGRAVMILIRSRCSRRNMSRTDEAELHVDLNKLKVLLMLLFSFIFGNYIGAFLYVHFGHWNFMIAAAITGLMGFIYTLFRETLKRNLKDWERSKVTSIRLRLHDALRQRKNANTTHFDESNRGRTQEEIDEEEEIFEEMEEFVDIIEHEVEEDQAARRASTALGAQGDRRAGTRTGRSM